MVLIKAKFGKDLKKEVLYETKSNSLVSDVCKNIVMIWNLRQKVYVVAEYIKDLSKHGPMKSPEEKGIDHIKDEETRILGGTPPTRSANYCEDEKGERTGEPPSKRMQKLFAEIVDKSLLVETSKENCTSCKEFEERLALMRGAVMMAYPMGLPSWDPLFILLNPKCTKPLNEVVEGCFSPEEVEIWWAGKQLIPESLLSDRIGKNEKTTIKCRVIKTGSGPPMREPIVSEKERKAMMALYYKKQEQAKKLAENDDDYYLEQTWADPSGLKTILNGTQNIRLF